MVEVGVDVEGDTVERHPTADADADGGDLVLAPSALVGRVTQIPTAS